MKKFALILMILCCSCAFAQQGVLLNSIDSDGYPKPNSKQKPAWVSLIGESGATASLDLVLPTVAYATPTCSLIATGTVKYLQQIASFTAGQLLEVQAKGKMYVAPISRGQTTTASALQNGDGKTLEAGDTAIYRFNTTCDMAFVADTAAAATVTLHLIRED